MLSYLTVLVIILVSLGISILVLGAFDICFGLYIKTYCRGKSEEKILSLSFDDGPHPQYTSAVLDLLKEYNIKSGFFVVGHRIEKSPELVRRIIAEGHIVGNHSFAHTNKYAFRRWKKLIEDLKKNEDLISTLANKKVNLFRPPFVVTNPNIAAAARFLEYTIVGWSIRSLDTMGKPAEKIIKRVVSRFRPGGLILLHDTHEDIAPILKKVIDEALKQGYTFVSPDVLLNLKAYK